MSKKIFISSFFGTRNKGDQLMLLGLLGLLHDLNLQNFTISTLYNTVEDSMKIDGVKFTPCLGRANKQIDKVKLFLAYYYLKIFHSKLCVKILKKIIPEFSDTISEIETSSFLITTGGPFAVETTKTFCGVKVSSFNFITFFFELQVAKSLNIPYAILGQSFGSLKTSCGKRNFKSIIESTSFVYSRESGGLSLFLRSLDIKTNIHVLPDLAFYRNLFNSKGNDYTDTVQKLRSKKYIVINVRNMSLSELQYLFDTEESDVTKLQQKYFSIFSNIIKFLFQSESFDFFVFFTQAINNDSIAAKNVIIQTGITDDIFWVTPDNLTVKSSFEIFKNCRFCITTRYHSLIFAFLVNSPVLPVAYNPKIIYMLNDLSIDIPVLKGGGFSFQKFCDLYKNTTFSYSNVHCESASEKLEKELTLLFTNNFQKKFRKHCF